MPSQAPSSAPAKAAVAALCTAAAPITLLYDALQNGLAAAVRSLGVEGVTVAVADAQCSKGSELAFRVQLRCTSADPDLPAAVAKTLTGPAGVAAALAQLKRTTVGVFGEAGLVMLSQLRLETLVGGAGSTSGSSNNTTNDGSRGANVSAAASESAGAGDANLIDASNKAAAAAGTGAAAVQAATGVADGGDAAGVVDAAEHGAQQTAVEMADASIDGTVAADGSVSG
ncbi:hypothetical protein HYH02_007625 [Chlamydomonas schloesseri]|uniref:Uncharacterized protein n=1 Tax=Chlamydomonas schloesseri TaxID=2026947 RepID=A0A835WH19_9CHLO|nr:hypothetical protein HYH02_007625 [Chlamydomonas schloesseri]|eukprot:KAG2447295.1 hypothetical protein HYH02_007625 [Chlamydomonas schloesseri]